MSSSFTWPPPISTDRCETCDRAVAADDHRFLDGQGCWIKRTHPESADRRLAAQECYGQRVNWRARFRAAEDQLQIATGQLGQIWAALTGADSERPVPLELVLVAAHRLAAEVAALAAEVAALRASAAISRAAEVAALRASAAISRAATIRPPEQDVEPIDEILERRQTEPITAERRGRSRGDK